MGKHTDNIAMRLKEHCQNYIRESKNVQINVKARWIELTLWHVSVMMVIELYQSNMLENKNNIGNILTNVLHGTVDTSNEQSILVCAISVL